MPEHLCVIGFPGFMASHFWELAGLDKNYDIRLFTGDITKPEDCVRNLRDMDTVINFAALTYLPPAWDSPDAYTRVNYSGVLNLLQCHQMFKKFVQISTVHVYGNQTDLPISVDSNFPRPNDPYSIAKFSAELAVKAYANRYGFEFLILRPYNNFGPRQSKDFAIPSFCLQAIKNNKIIVKGNSKREFLYVKDNVRAIKHFLDIKKKGLVQISKGETYEMKQIAEWLCPNVEVIESDRPHDIKELWGAPTFGKNEFQWTPMQEALKETLDYYRTRA